MKKKVITALSLIAMSSAFFVGCQKQEVSAKTNYEQVETKSSVGMNKLDDLLKNKEKVTLILFRKDCPACQNVEKDLVSGIDILKNNTKQNVLVLDLNKLSASEKQDLMQKVPEIVVDGDKLASPTVANLSYKNDQEYKVDQKVIGDNKNHIEKVLEQAN